MADTIMSYAITVGIFVFLTAILFGTRARRRSHGYGKTSTKDSQTEAA